MQLTIAIMYDLGIDKPPSRDPALMLAYDLKGYGRPATLSRTPTMEERRVVLCCFLMSSAQVYCHLLLSQANSRRSCSISRKGSSLRWTSYANECLHILGTQKEVESDVLLVQLVKLRLISERVKEMPWSHSAEIGTTTRVPVMALLSSLEAQLEDFKSNIPSEVSSNSK